jgi:hypothetical protein
MSELQGLLPAYLIEFKLRTLAGKLLRLEHAVFVLAKYLKKFNHPFN